MFLEYHMEATGAHDPKVYEDDTTQIEDEDDDDVNTLNTDELFYPYLPRIKLIVDVPPWFAAYALTLLAYTFSAAVFAGTIKR